MFSKFTFWIDFASCDLKELKTNSVLKPKNRQIDIFILKIKKPVLISIRENVFEIWAIKKKNAPESSEIKAGRKKVLVELV